jgi:hypothetical protein
LATYGGHTAKQQVMLCLVFFKKRIFAPKKERKKLQNPNMLAFQVRKSSIFFVFDFFFNFNLKH